MTIGAGGRFLRMSRRVPILIAAAAGPRQHCLGKAGMLERWAAKAAVRGPPSPPAQEGEGS